MQADPPDTVSVPTSSPPLSPFGQQTALARDDLRLRRTAPSPHPRGMLKLHLWMPYADLGPNATTGTWNVHPSTTVREAKAAIASGSAGYGTWELNGLRLIWRGRVLADDEVLEAAFAGIDEPTVHVVARPLVSGVSQPEPPRQPATSSTGVALAETVHYLIFVCREHMSALLGRKPLAWEDTYPAPTVARDEAYKGILTIVRTYAGEQWAAALQGDGDRKALEGAWVAIGSEAMMKEVNLMWRDLVGREYGPNGDTAQVELDLDTFTLHLPPLKEMVPAQLTHLLFYLRTATLVRYLSACLAEVEASRTSREQPAPTPAPTPTVQAPPRVLYQSSIRIRVPRISFALVQHQFWSAMRMVTILWMLTRGMRWTDTRLWILIIACTLWWSIDGFNHWLLEDRARAEARLRRIMHAENQARAAARAAAPEDAPLDPAAQAAADAPLHAAAAARAGAAAIRPRQGTPRRAHGVQLLLQLPFMHMEEDAAQTRIRIPRYHGTGLPPRTVATLPSDTPQVPVLLPEPRSTPSRWVTNALLPAALWFLTLVPSFEAQRAREIRQRERNMRAVIADLNPEETREENSEENQENREIRENESGEDRQEGEENTEPAPPQPPRLLVLPSGLSLAARNYYLRVAATTESIDWEEEREAQRAMGIPDEDEGAAAGAGFMGLF